MFNEKNCSEQEREFLRSYNPADYPRPSFTADNLIFSLPPLAAPGAPCELLLIKRGGFPERGKWALPGGFLNPGESAESAALRELKEETNISALIPEPLGVFSDPGRDPRGFTITSAYIALADRRIANAAPGDDAARAEWFTLRFILLAEKIQLSLTSGGETLEALLSFREHKTLFGRRYNIEILNDGGLAFDHAKIIAHAVFHLKAHGLLK